MNMNNMYQQDQDNRKPLEKYGFDLVERAREQKLDPVIGRDEEIRNVIRILSRKTKTNPVLIGEPGVGKSAVVEGFAMAIVEGRVPDSLLGKTIFSLNLSGMLAGTRYRGDFEERLKNAIDFVVSDGSIILFIDEIHNLIGVGASGEGKFDAADILKPMLARGELTVIGATTYSEYRKYIEKDSAFERRFSQVYVDPPTVEDAVKGADFVMETIVEKKEAKEELYAQLAQILPKDVIVASNTSALNIFEIVPEALLPQQIICHW